MQLSKTRYLATSLALTLLASASSPLAIVIRHDQDATLYRELGQGYPEIVELGNALGTLIASDWVLTAAHVADGLSPVSDTVLVGSQRIPIKRIVRHPRWAGYLGPGLAQPDWVDAALVQLAHPVNNIAPVGLYKGDGELKQIARLVGNGMSGDGQSGPTARPDTMLGANNRIVSVNDDWIQFEFEAPPAGEPLEGISGPGDSGGPAYINVGGQRRLAGVSSRNVFVDRGLDECVYGTGELYTRVSRLLPWINATLADKNSFGLMQRLSQQGWPDSDAAQLAREFFAAFDDAESGALKRFAERTLHQQQNSLQSAEEWATLWERQSERYGKVEAVYFIEGNAWKFTVLAASRELWRSFHFELIPSADRKKRPMLRELKVRRTRTVGGQALPPVASILEPKMATESEENEP